MITIAVYLHQRAYGGPEEGGWWYDTYEPCFDDEFLLFIQHYPSTPEYAEDVEGWINHVQYILDETYNAHRTEVSSVNSDGVYVARATEGYEITPHPLTRPHYE